MEEGRHWGVKREGDPMIKSKTTLTDALVIGLKVKATKYCVWDHICPGFGVEVTPNKLKLMIAKTSQDGRRAWHTLGHYGVSGVEWTDLVTGEPKSRRWNVDDYRLKAMTLKAAVKKGEDPKAAVLAKKAEALAHRQRYTMNQLADRFIKDHIRAQVTKDGEKLIVTKQGAEGNRISTAKEHVRLIEKHIRPALGALPVEDVGTDVIDGMLQRIKDETPIQANRVRSLLSAMFNDAEKWQKRAVGTNPVTVQDRAAETKRKRNLADKEIQALGVALASAETPKEGEDALSPYPVAAIRLALLTGMRKGEILALRWDWTDLVAKEIRIPAEFHKTGGRTGDDRVVMLCAAACTLLKSLPKVLGNPFVIAGKGHNALVQLQDPWEQVRKAAGLSHEDDKKQVHFHDLRRSFSSVANRMGYSELWIGALLGHTAGTVTAGYARIDEKDDPLRKALEAIGARIAGLLEGSIDLKKEAEEAQKTKMRA